MEATAVILTVIYLSKRTHIETTRHYQVKSWKECVFKGYQLRSRIVTGKVKLKCNGKPI